MRQSEDEKNSGDLIAVKLPFPIPIQCQDESIQGYLSKSDMQKIFDNNQCVSLSNTPIISVSKKKLAKPLYYIKTTQYRDKMTGQLIQHIEHSEQISKMYDYIKMPDFFIEGEKKDQRTIDDMKNMLRKKILDNQYNLDEYKFVAKPVEFLKGFNLPITNSDMLVNKLKGLKKQFKPQHIGFNNPIPNGPDTIPAYVTNLKIFNTVQEYLKKRPCWLRNVLQYQLRLDGFKGQYTTNQLKNILKFVCYTYRDGPWKHVFCRFGYNPTENKESTLYQILMVKIKRKQVEDYDEINEEQNDVYDPTLREMPTKYMRIYQLCDIEDKRVEELVKGTAVLSDQCNKETGWFSKTEYNQLQKITKSIREQRSKN